MYDFWLPALLLLCLASLFVIVPSFRFASIQRQTIKQNKIQANENKERTAQNVLIYKERLNELQLDKNSGVIGDEQYAQLKEELDNTLLEDADRIDQSHSDSTSSSLSKFSSIGIILGSVSVVVALSAALYNHYGAYNDVVAYLEGSESNAELASATEQARNGDMSALLEQLHAKLKDNPNNIQGWGLLARTAMNTERYSLAVDAFEQVTRLLKEAPEINYQDLAATYGITAQAQYYASKGIFTDALKGTIDKALELNPSEPNTLSLLAINAFTSEDFSLAIEYWSKVLEAYPEHPAAGQMKQGINEAQRRAGIELSDFSSDSSGSLIDVFVSLDETLLGSVKPGDTVFVFVKNAENANQASPPLAASRHTVSELPLTINLSDADAMSPAAKLSDAKLVNVTARVSKSGQVSAASGDFEGRAELVELGSEQQVKINISELVK